MKSRTHFATLEIMCRERAAVAKKEMEYWLTEAEEWRRLKLSPDHLGGEFQSSSIGAQTPMVIERE